MLSGRDCCDMACSAKPAPGGDHPDEHDLRESRRVARECLRLGGETRRKANRRREQELQNRETHGRAVLRDDLAHGDDPNREERRRSDAQDVAPTDGAGRASGQEIGAGESEEGRGPHRARGRLAIPGPDGERRHNSAEIDQEARIGDARILEAELQKRHARGEARAGRQDGAPRRVHGHQEAAKLLLRIGREGDCAEEAAPADNGERPQILERRFAGNIAGAPADRREEHEKSRLCGAKADAGHSPAVRHSVPIPVEPR